MNPIVVTFVRSFHFLVFSFFSPLFFTSFVNHVTSFPRVKIQLAIGGFPFPDKKNSRYFSLLTNDELEILEVLFYPSVLFLYPSIPRFSLAMQSSLHFHAFSSVFQFSHVILIFMQRSSSRWAHNPRFYTAVIVAGIDDSRKENKGNIKKNLRKKKKIPL